MAILWHQLTTDQNRMRKLFVKRAFFQWFVQTKLMTAHNENAVCFWLSTCCTLVHTGITLISQVSNLKATYRQTCLIQCSKEWKASGTLLFSIFVWICFLLLLCTFPLQWYNLQYDYDEGGRLMKEEEYLYYIRHYFRYWYCDSDIFKNKTLHIYLHKLVTCTAPYTDGLFSFTGNTPKRKSVK